MPRSKDSLGRPNAHPLSAAESLGRATANSGIIPGVGYQQLFDAVPCYISVQDANYRILHANRKLKERFHCETGDYCYVAYKRRNDVCPDCPLTKTFADGQVHQTEETVVDRSGEQITVITYTSPIHAEDGKIAAVMEASTDITELKELQHHLTESRERFQTLFDSVPCYISVQDRSFRILEANRLFKEEFGDHVGDHCYRVCKRREEKCRVCPVAQTFEDGEVHTSEEEMQTQSGETRSLIVYAAPLVGLGGKIAAVIKMSTDISEVKKLQRHLVSLGQMVATVSHNIKDILGGLDGGMYIVKSGLERGDEERLRKGWEMVERNVGRVSRQVSDVLAYAKERVPRRVMVSPREIIEEVSQLFEEKARSRGITIEHRVGPSAAHFLADPSALHVALVNLMSNAIDACREDGLKPKHRVTLTAGIEGTEVVFEVSDDGKGIPEDVKPHIFQDFFSTKGADGTGIGLLVVQKIVREHGGTILFRSKEGCGTTFTMRFPLS